MKKYIDISKKYLSKLNKYWVAIIFFAVITFFIGEHSLYNRIKYNREITHLQREIGEQKQIHESNLKEIEALQADDEVLEKYAREELLMVKPNEEVFLIKD
ncbi:septum formation initiator family protein [Bacteroidales bacterium OttesenSCG-928-J19]|nr:septum formation initiator family protein [Bacteroidales bacterium OttesenSCG-928-J19]